MRKIDIFYADDDEDDLMFFSDAIEKISNGAKNLINLHIHKSGESLIENLKKANVKNCVVFLDINMPRKSGFDFLKEIRTEPEINQFPVIMYSTSSDKDSIEKSINLGANYYVVKPYDFSDLLEMITKFCEVNWENQVSDIGSFLYIKK